MRKKSSYRPRPKVNPVVWGIPQQAKVMLQMIPQQELARFKDGTANAVSVNTLICRLNFSYLMCCNLFDNPEARKVTEAALEAVRKVKARSLTGKYGATGEEFNAIGASLCLADEMQEQATRREVEEVLSLTFNLGALQA